MKKYFKKSLSIFLSLLMVFTSLVFVVPEFKAEAVSAGKYDYLVRVKTTDDVDVGDNKDLVFTLTYKAENGTSSTTATKVQNQPYTWAETNNADNTFEFKDVNGFPESLNIYCCYAWTAAIARTWGVTITVSVKDKTNSTWKQIANQSFSQSGNSSGQTDMNYKITSFSGAPTPTNINWTSADIDAQTISKTGNTTKTFRYTVLDQYGVVMSTTALKNLSKSPVVTVTGSKVAEIGASTSNSIYHTNTDVASYFQETITVKPEAQGKTWDQQTITVNVKVGDTLSSSKEYVINDNVYKYSLDPNSGNFKAGDITSVEKPYYTAYGTMPTPEKIGYTFRGFYEEKDEDFTDDLPAENNKLTATTPIIKDATWYASWKINQYKSTFTYKLADGTDKTEEITATYNTNYNVPKITKEVIANDVKYTFVGWSPELSVDENGQATMGAESKTYNAKYDSVNLYADYSKVNVAIEDAEKLINSADYKAKYTESSRNALTIAMTSVVRDLGLSKQEQVDAYATAINNAVKNLEVNKFVVLFLDEDGNIIKDGYNLVEYGGKVTVPTKPEKAYDGTYHYEFSKWSEDTSACENVTDDLTFVAEFNKSEHSFSETPVSSTCTTDGVIEHTCECGYSYTVANENDKASHKWNDEKDVIVPATCGSSGVKATKCSACGAIDEKSIETFKAEGEHQWETDTIVKATCDNAGVEVSTCKVCQAVKYEKKDQLTHNWTGAKKVGATCTSAGYIVKKCSVCEKTYIDENSIEPVTSHNLSATTVNPTCTNAGYKKTACSKCNYSEIEIIPATNKHNIPETWTLVTNATCGSTGLEKRECSVCHGMAEYKIIPATGEHTYNENDAAQWKVTTEATCENAGIETISCSVCKAVMNTRAIEAKGHDWEKDVVKSYLPTCEEDGLDVEVCKNNCGNTKNTIISKLGHKYEKTASTAATCATGATETWTCMNDEEHTYTIITELAKGHKYDEGVVIQNANCKQEEITRYSCTVDGCKQNYEVMTKSKTAHTWVEVKAVEPATETTPGARTIKCSVCGIEERVTIEPTGDHEFILNAELSKPATCTTDGKNVYVCSKHEDCSYEEIIYAKGHDVELETVDATCTQTGSVKAVCKNEGCGEVIDEYTLPMLNHNYNEVEGARKDATCTEPGKYTVKCDCGDEKEISIPATGHDYKESTADATCTEPAKTIYTCKCGNSYYVTSGDAKGHSWGAWNEKTAATENAAGIQERECGDCHKTEEAPIPPMGGHTFVKDSDASTDATCTTAGSIVYICTADHNCGVTYTQNVEATGHNVTLSYREPTCTEDGYANTYCVNCLTTVENHAIPKLGHKLKATSTTPAKCGEAGEIVYTCENKNCKYSTTETIDALEHEFVVEVKGTRVEPTCITDGKVTMKCINCDETTEKILTKTGHDYSGEGNVLVKPDCVTTGKIEYVCKYDSTHKFTETIPATGEHNLVGEIVSYTANCEEGAKETQYCEKCKNWVVLSEGEALGHDWSEWIVESLPTATEDGYQYRTCARDNCHKKEEMTLTAGRMFHVAFYDQNGERLTAPKYYTYGSNVVRPSDPFRNEDEINTYEFIGWRFSNKTVEETEKMLNDLGYGWDYSDPNSENTVKEMALVAVYKHNEKSYKVTYINDNGSAVVIENVPYFDINTAYQELYGEPTKASTDVYQYKFIKWSISCHKDEKTGENIATATPVFVQSVIPGKEDEVVEEPTMFMKLMQSILDFFKNLLSRFGFKFD